jgi:hypothetical protein
LLPVVLLLGLAEVYLRYFPPDYLHTFLGENAPLTGHLVADPDFGVGFASWEELAKDNPNTLGPRSELLPHQQYTHDKVWLVLGNSFGYELAARMRRVFPQHTILNLDQREKLTVRLAQIKTLLENDCRPERIFLVVIPHDFQQLAAHDLCHHTANSKGGYVIEPHLPPSPGGDIITISRLAFSAWARLGFHCDRPSLKMRQLLRHVPEDVQRDERHMFTALGQIVARHQVPVTVILIPGRTEIVRRPDGTFEDTLVSIMKDAGVSYLDPRKAFLAQANRQDLYVPDGHLSELGNLIVLEELKKHLRSQNPVADAGGMLP